MREIRFEKQRLPLSDISNDELREMVATWPHDKGTFTRRKAIEIANLFGMEAMELVESLEKRGVIRKGSLDWFKSNGGITDKHVEQAKQGRLV